MFMKTTLIATLIYLSMLLFLHAQVIAQDLSAIDNNNGFQNFKFGMEKNEFSDCSFTVVENGGAERCRITDTYYINDLSIGITYLYFVDSKLAKIELNLSKEDSGQLLQAVKSAFGESTYHYPTSSELENMDLFQRHTWNEGGSTIYKWEANKTTLTYRRANRMFVMTNLIFELSNYEELQEIYRSRKYTPSDF